jgi:hypothetical protein
MYANCASFSLGRNNPENKKKTVEGITKSSKKYAKKLICSLKQRNSCKQTQKKKEV